jgi:nucleotide-binding universal stress UspA family protein
MVLLGVDGSDASRETSRFAVSEAKRWQTGLHIVHAFSEWEPTPGTEIEQDRGSEEREAWLAAFVCDPIGETTDVGVTESMVEDDPVPALLAAARDDDLLVVGSRGHGGFAELMLGSVGPQCAHHASCPVVIVRGRHAAD